MATPPIDPKKQSPQPDGSENKDFEEVYEKVNVDEIDTSGLEVATTMDATNAALLKQVEKTTNAIPEIEDISAYIAATKEATKEKEKAPTQFLTMDGTDLSKLPGVYGIVPHQKGDHKVVFLRSNAPAEITDDPKMRTKGSTYQKDGDPIYQVHVDMKQHASLRTTEGRPLDVWLIDTPQDLDNQIQAIYDGKGGGTNFSLPIVLKNKPVTLPAKPKDTTASKKTPNSLDDAWKVMKEKMQVSAETQTTQKESKGIVEEKKNLQTTSDVGKEPPAKKTQSKDVSEKKSYEKETPANEIKVNQAKAKELSAKETKLNEVPADKMSVSKVQPKETPMEATPIKKTSKEATPTEEMPVQNPPTKESSKKGTPNKELPREGKKQPLEKQVKEAEKQTQEITSKPLEPIGTQDTVSPTPASVIPQEKVSVIPQKKIDPPVQEQPSTPYPVFNIDTIVAKQDSMPQASTKNPSNPKEGRETTQSEVPLNTEKPLDHDPSIVRTESKPATIEEMLEKKPADDLKELLATKNTTTQTPIHPQSKTTPTPRKSLLGLSKKKRIGILIFLLFLVGRILYVMFGNSRSPAPQDSPANTLSGDIAGGILDSEQPGQQPTNGNPIENDNELPTDVSPTPTPQPSTGGKETRFTMAELVAKLEDLQVEARKVVNQARQVGNREAIKFSIAALQKATNTLEEIETDATITADQVEKDAARAEKYLQDALDLLENNAR